MNKKTIEGLRRHYDLPESISDEEIKSKLSGSLGEELVNLSIAMKALSVSLKETLLPIRAFINKRK